MARSKKSSVKKSSEEIVEEVFDENEIVEDVEEGYTESPAVDYPPVSDMELAKQLKGHPVLFGSNYSEALARLVEQGIAADFGEDGHARGHKWRLATKK